MPEAVVVNALSVIAAAVVLGLLAYAVWDFVRTSRVVRVTPDDLTGHGIVATTEPLGDWEWPTCRWWTPADGDPPPRVRATATRSRGVSRAELRAAYPALALLVEADERSGEWTK